MNKADEYEILERAHEAAGAHMMQKSPRADELIACLEGEIAKRDARIVELERYDEAVERAAFEAWHKDRYPAVKIRVQNLLGTYTNMQVECNFETWLACAESHSKRFGGALLDANARLNGPPVSEAKARGVVMDGSQLAGLLEQVRLNDDEAKPHGSGATYWNNAVIACQVAIRDALDAPVQQVSVPDGWTVERGYSPNGYVLHSPSGSMIRVCDSGMGGIETAFAMFLKAMLAAAPAAPAVDAGVISHD